MRGVTVVDLAAQVDDDGIVRVQGATTVGIAAENRGSPLCDQFCSGIRHHASPRSRPGFENQRSDVRSRALVVAWVMSPDFLRARQPAGRGSASLPPTQSCS
jgi:hypothetical protein